MTGKEIVIEKIEIGILLIEAIEITKTLIFYLFQEGVPDP